MNENPITQEQYHELPDSVKLHFTLDEAGNVKPAIDPEQVRQTQAQLRQEAISAKQQADAQSKALNEFQAVLPEEFRKSPEKLGDYFLKKTTGTETLEGTLIEEKLKERDKRHEEKIKIIEAKYREEMASIEKQNNELKKAEKERMVFEAMQKAARQNKLKSKFDAQFFNNNRTFFNVNGDNELLITDSDGLASGTTVDKFFASQREQFGEMFEGSEMSGTGIESQRRTIGMQNRIKPNNLALLNNIDDIIAGNVKVVR